MPREPAFATVGSLRRCTNLIDAPERAQLALQFAVDLEVAGGGCGRPGPADAHARLEQLPKCSTQQEIGLVLRRDDLRLEGPRPAAVGGDLEESPRHKRPRVSGDMVRLRREAESTAMFGFNFC